MQGEALSLLGRYRIERAVQASPVLPSSLHRTSLPPALLVAATHFCRSRTVSAAAGCPKSCTSTAQHKRGAMVQLRELTVPLLLAKLLTPALHLLLSLQCRCSLGGQILTSTVCITMLL